MSDDGFTVDLSDGVRYDLDRIRTRNDESFMPDGQHAWIISAVYAIDDPEESMNLMTLGESNFIGVSAIRCLLCNEQYAGSNRYYKCSQRIVT